MLTPKCDFVARIDNSQEAGDPSLLAFERVDRSGKWNHIADRVAYTAPSASTFPRQLAPLHFWPLTLDSASLTPVPPDDSLIPGNTERENKSDHNNESVNVGSASWSLTNNTGSEIMILEMSESRLLEAPAGQALVEYTREQQAIKGVENKNLWRLKVFPRGISTGLLPNNPEYTRPLSMAWFVPFSLSHARTHTSYQPFIYINIYSYNIMFYHIIKSNHNQISTDIQVLPHKSYQTTHGLLS